jgi:RISC-loading complex subunit TARBP2
LQELCTARKLSPPIYELSAEDGLPHDRLFAIECIIGKQKACGTGKSKKLAKRQAAHKLLMELKDIQPDQGAASSHLDVEDDVS